MTDLSIVRGDGTYLDVAIANSDPATIAAATFRFTAKLSVSDADSRAVIVKFSGGGGITVNSTAMTLAIDLATADTAWMPFPAYRTLLWDVTMVPADGSGPYTVADGQLRLTPDVWHG